MNNYSSNFSSPAIDFAHRLAIIPTYPNRPTGAKAPTVKNTDLNAVKIPADLTKKCEIVTLNSESPLSSMYLHIGCSMVQPLTVGVKNVLLWCDEEILCHVDNPPFNVRASILARQPIFGDTILAGDNGEEVTSLLMDCPAIFFDALQQEAEKFAAEGIPTVDECMR